MKKIHFQYYGLKPELVIEVAPKRSAHLAALLFNHREKKSNPQLYSQVLTSKHKMPSIQASLTKKERRSKRNHTAISTNSVIQNLVGPQNGTKKRLATNYNMNCSESSEGKQKLWEIKLKKNQVHIQFPQTLLIEEVLQIQERFVKNPEESVKKPRLLVPLPKPEEQQQEEQEQKSEKKEKIRLHPSQKKRISVESIKVAGKPVKESGVDEKGNGEAISAWTIKHWT